MYSLVVMHAPAGIKNNYLSSVPEDSLVCDAPPAGII